MTRSRKYKKYYYDAEPYLTNYKRKKLKKSMPNMEMNQNSFNIFLNSNQLQSHTSLEVNISERNNVDLNAEIISYTPHINNEENNGEIVSQRLTYNYEWMDDGITSDTVWSMHNISQQYYNSFNKYSLLDEYYNEGQSSEISKALKLQDQNADPFSVLINGKGFFDPIGIQIDRTPAELFLMGLNFSSETFIPHSRVTNLLQLINSICGDKVLPDTRYLIDKLYNSLDNVTFFCVCTKCSKVLGEFKDLEKSVVCNLCNTNTDAANISNICYFCIIDPCDAVREQLELHEDYYEYVVKHRLHDPSHIKDIYDGQQYQQFLNSLSESDRYSYVTATLNTDGVPVFKSSNFSIYPFYLMLNELPAQFRFDNVIKTALWFGPSKPEMNGVLDVLVDKINSISSTGIPCKIKNESVNIKLYILIACTDTIARNQMNGTIQFNGKYGCDWCLIEGVRYNNSNRYPYNKGDHLSYRNKVLHVLHANEAVRTRNPVYGVRYASPLLKWLKFDITRGFTVDYMHCVPSGVVTQLTDNILDPLSKEEISEIDEILLNIKVPNQLCRLTRAIKDRANWKAREYENWLLYYSLPVLDSNNKTKKFVKHWSLLVESMHICLQEDITPGDLNYVCFLLEQFVSDVRKMYSLSDMTYNVHQLLHIPQSILDWGPLWAHSAFCFESANHELLKTIKSARGVILQVLRHVNLQRFVKLLKLIVYPECSPVVLKFIENLNYSKIKPSYKLNSTSYFGKNKYLSSSDAISFNMPTTTEVHSRIVLKGCLYHSCNIDNDRSCNSYAVLQNGSFIKIKSFLVDSQSQVEKTTCYVLRTRSHKYLNSVKEVTSISKNITCVPTMDISSICVFMKIKKKNLIVPVPNSYFY